MKQITNKEYEEWQKYKVEKAKGHVLLPDTVRFICEANGYDAEKIGQHFLEILPKICPKEEREIFLEKVLTLQFTEPFNYSTLFNYFSDSRF